MGLLIAVAIVAVVLVVLGVVIEGLLWLLFIGALLVAVVFVVGLLRGRRTRT